MFELLEILVELLPLVVGAAALDVDALGPALEEALRPLHDVDAAVWPRQVGVVDEVDRFAQRRANERRVHVAQRVRLPAARIVRLERFLIKLEPARRAAHGDEILQAIAAIDVHALRDRTESVRGIEIAVAPHRVRAAPQAFAVRRELHAAQVVQIAALAVQNLSEQPAPDEIETEHLRPVVAAILHHHAVAEMFLRVFDELPALVERDGGGHLGGRVLARFHRGDTHGHVPFPRRGGEDEIEIFGLAQALEIARAARVRGRRRPAVLFAGVLNVLDLVRDDVADRLDLDAGNLHEAVEDVMRAHPADADEAHAHALQRRRGEVAVGRGAEPLRRRGAVAPAGRLAAGGAERREAGERGQAEEIAPRVGLSAIGRFRCFVRHGVSPGERRRSIAAPARTIRTRHASGGRTRGNRE